MPSWCGSRPTDHARQVRSCFRHPLVRRWPRSPAQSEGWFLEIDFSVRFHQAKQSFPKPFWLRSACPVPQTIFECGADFPVSLATLVRAEFLGASATIFRYRLLAVDALLYEGIHYTSSRTCDVLSRRHLSSQASKSSMAYPIARPPRLRKAGGWP